MARVSYVALRSLQGGVSVDDDIDFDFEVAKADRKTKTDRKDHIALGGAQASIKNRTDEQYMIGTIPVLEADFPDFRQFLDSVDAGEQFTLDPYGTLASPVLALNCVMVSKGYKEKRISERWLSTSFEVRVVS